MAGAYTFPDAHIQPVGPPVTVFDWSADKCEEIDIPDAPARAYRDESDQVQFFASHFVTRRMTGPTLDDLHHDCTVAMSSFKDPDPAAFQDREWIASPYAVTGSTVAALVHEEYQAVRYPDQCPSGVHVNCWYNAITLAMSSDGGRTFTHAAAPAHLVASSAYRYVPDQGPMGVFQPSNIMDISDGTVDYYYALVMVQQYGAQQRGVCVMRTTDLTQPDGWRAWDGTGFNVAFANPYAAEIDPLQHICQPVSVGNIGLMSSSLTWSTYLNKFVLVGTSDTEFANDTTQPGIYYSTSSNLIDWDEAKLILPRSFFWTHRCGDEDPILYPSLLDPNSTSRNFSTIGRSANLYFTQFHFAYGHGTCWASLNRDLIKIPVEFDQPPDCSTVQAVPDVLPNLNRKLFPVFITGASDPADAVTTSITAVTQNEPLRGPGDWTTPDAVRLSTNRVLLRAERNLKGTGRVYQLSVTATDSTDQSCSTTVTVSIPRGAPDSEPRYDSFGSP